MSKCFVYIGILLFFVSVYTEAQEHTTHSNKFQFVKSKVIHGDTIPHIALAEIKILPPLKFMNKRHRKRYGRLVVNVKKTLPYARIAKNRLIEISQVLDTISNAKMKKEYVKKAEKELFEEFEQPLRKLTFSQGRLLIKLVDRETGDTSYKLIKDLKGGFSALIWQSVARIFGSNLKSEYDMEGDDVMIERIIIMIDNGML
jgi:hypothetical protein